MEKNDPNVDNKATILIEWSSTLTRSAETVEDKLRVIVKSKAIPAKIP